MGKWECGEFDLELPQREDSHSWKLEEVMGARELGVNACDMLCVLWRVDSNHEMAFWKDF